MASKSGRQDRQITDGGYCGHSVYLPGLQAEECHGESIRGKGCKGIGTHHPIVVFNPISDPSSGGEDPRGREIFDRLTGLLEDASTMAADTEKIESAK